MKLETWQAVQRWYWGLAKVFAVVLASVLLLEKLGNVKMTDLVPLLGALAVGAMVLGGTVLINLGAYKAFGRGIGFIVTGVTLLIYSWLLIHLR